MAPARTIEIVRLDPDGAGVGYAGGREVHVAGAIPGDVVQARTEHRSPHRGADWARLLRVVEPSRYRVDTPCPHFSDCGGCPLMPQRYDIQLVAKAARLRRALGPDAPIDLVTPAPRIWDYRRVAKYVAVRRGGRTVLGSYAPRSRRVADMAGCLVVEPPLRAVADEVARLADHLAAPLRYLLLRSARDGRVLATLVAWRRADAHGELARALRRARPEVAGVLLHENDRRDGALLDAGAAFTPLDGAADLADDGVAVGPATFLQVNREVADLLYDAVVEQARLSGVETVLDLYCGPGVLSARLAERAATVIAVDTVPAPPGRYRFVQADVAAFLRDAPRADVVVVDPPRKGLGPEICDLLVGLAAPRLLYVSCNPESLARDLERLAPGYALAGLLPFDMMPQTPEVEALAVLTRREPP